ncbi:MAG: hypothetical protein ABFD08_18135 [Syntrophomonas sp.]
MKKNFPLVAFAVMFLLIICCPAYAAQNQWQVQWQDNGKLIEQVIVDKQTGLAGGGSEWKQSENNGVLNLQREVQDWKDYNLLKERLPVKAKVKNYIVMQATTLKFDKEAADYSFFRQFLSSQDANIKIQVTGYINEVNAGELKDMTANWDAGRMAALQDGDILLKAYTFNGLNLGAVIFGLGFLIVALYVFFKIRKINKYIDERYALDSNDADFEDEEDDKWK